ncbi:MAG: hypothetical protein KDI02_25675 [Anaerolineae bacterium]|nr:hypothetical protein [Anaerolineae bacterium]
MRESVDQKVKHVGPYERVVDQMAEGVGPSDRTVERMVKRVGRCTSEQSIVWRTRQDI